MMMLRLFAVLLSAVSAVLASASLPAEELEPVSTPQPAYFSRDTLWPAPPVDLACISPGDDNNNTRAMLFRPPASGLYSIRVNNTRLLQPIANLSVLVVLGNGTLACHRSSNTDMEGGLHLNSSHAYIFLLQAPSSPNDDYNLLSVALMKVEDALYQRFLLPLGVTGAILTLLLVRCLHGQGAFLNVVVFAALLAAVSGWTVLWAAGLGYLFDLLAVHLAVRHSQSAGEWRASGCGCALVAALGLANAIYNVATGTTTTTVITGGEDVLHGLGFASAGAHTVLAACCHHRASTLRQQVLPIKSSPSASPQQLQRW